jgi:hypothetical protein
VMLMKSAIFWVITRRRVVIVYRLLTREDGTDKCPETSVNNYHMTPRNIPKERRSQNFVCISQ